MGRPPSVCWLLFACWLPRKKPHTHTPKKNDTSQGTAEKVTAPWKSTMPASRLRRSRLAVLYDGLLFLGPKKPKKHRLFLTACRWVFAQPNKTKKHVPNTFRRSDVFAALLFVFPFFRGGQKERKTKYWGGGGKKHGRKQTQKKLVFSASFLAPGRRRSGPRC